MLVCKEYRTNLWTPDFDHGLIVPRGVITDRDISGFVRIHEEQASEYDPVRIKQKTVDFCIGTGCVFVHCVLGYTAPSKCARSFLAVMLKMIDSRLPVSADYILLKQARWSHDYGLGTNVLILGTPEANCSVCRPWLLGHLINVLCVR